MAGKDNLDPIRSKEVARERQKKSVEKRKENRAKERIFAESIKQLLTDDDWREIILNAIDRAKSTDKGFEVVRDTLGQKPKEAVELSADKPFEIEIRTIE